MGRIEITEFDLVNFKVVFTVHGEEWETGRHPQGTEIKAITYSNMQILEDAERCDIYVIVDI